MSGTAAETVLPGLVREAIVIPIATPDGRQVKLEGLVIRPDAPGRFPLIVLVHGSPRSSSGNFLETYRRMSPAALAGPALAFAQRGYAAISILRRGFGRSEGAYAEFIPDPCEDTDYLRVARISAEDVNGAISGLRHQPWADPDRLVVLGHSTGGLAAIAAAASNPPGVVGVLDFAGGRGSFRPDEVCSPNRLEEAFAAFGRTTRIPSFWIFAENDHYLGLTLARRMFEAYTEAGAPGRFELLPPYGTDGHLLFTAGPTTLWWPSVETFLASLHLPTTLMIALPPPPSLSPPEVNVACASLFREYIAARTDAKAFAINPEGHCGTSVTARSLDEANAEALKLCSDRWQQCKLYASGQQLVEAVH